MADGESHQEKTPERYQLLQTTTEYTADPVTRYAGYKM